MQWNEYVLDMRVVGYHPLPYHHCRFFECKNIWLNLLNPACLSEQSLLPIDLGLNGENDILFLYIVVVS